MRHIKNLQQIYHQVYKKLYKNIIRKLTKMPRYYQNYSKKSLEAISKANYLQSYVLPDTKNTLFQTDQKLLVRNMKGERDHKYYWIQSQTIQGQSISDPSVLIEALQNVYEAKSTTRIDHHSFVNTHYFQPTYFQVARQFKQLVDIVVVEKSFDSKQQQSSKTSYLKISPPSKQRESESTESYKDYNVYIVHLHHSDQEKPFVKWETFVEKYDITTKIDSQKSSREDVTTSIQYSMVFSYLDQGSSSFTFLNYNSPTSFNTTFLETYFDFKKGNIEKMKRLQSYIFQLSELRKEQVNTKGEDRSGPQFSQQLRREKSIPAEHFMEFKKLKQKTLVTYIKANKQYIDKGQVLNPQMKVQNLVCRFLGQNKYDFEKTQNSIVEYLKFEKKLRSYSVQNFKKYKDMDILVNLGTDRVGRPIIFFKTYNFIASKIHDVQQYVDYLLYTFQIDVYKGRPGYIDDCVILADARNNSTKNFKLEVNTKMISQGNVHCPRRFFKIIIFGSDTFTYYVHKLVKPILPTYASEVISIFKFDFKEVKQVCNTFADDQSIPQILGGKCLKGGDISQNDKSTKYPN